MRPFPTLATRRAAALLTVAVILTSCGHQTKLVRPADIPEYERVRQQKIDKYAPYDPHRPSPAQE